MVNSDDSKFNLFPLIVHFIVTEDRASFHDILMQVEKTTGRKFDPTTVFKTCRIQNLEAQRRHYWNLQSSGLEVTGRIIRSLDRMRNFSKK